MKDLHINFRGWNGNEMFYAPDTGTVRTSETSILFKNGKYWYIKLFGKNLMTSQKIESKLMLGCEVQLQRRDFIEVIMVYECDIIGVFYDFINGEKLDHTEYELAVVELENGCFHIKTGVFETINPLYQIGDFEVVGNIYENPELLTER